MAKKVVLRDLTSDELRAKLIDAREELMKLRFQQATGELTDHTQLRLTRRNIARMMTLLGDRDRTARTEGEA